jgi:hypothetical protein
MGALLAQTTSSQMDLMPERGYAMVLHALTMVRSTGLGDWMPWVRKPNAK